jgi:hypothetical protein
MAIHIGTRGKNRMMAEQDTEVIVMERKKSHEIKFRGHTRSVVQQWRTVLDVPMAYHAERPRDRNWGSKG